MTPYYEDSACTIYHGDSRDWLDAATVTFDLVFADPPYGVNLRYTDEREDPPWSRTDIGDLAAQMLAVAPGRPVMVTPGIRNLSTWPSPRWILAWHKPGSTRRSDLRGFNTWEPILVYGDTPKTLYQDAVTIPFGSGLAHGSTGDHPCPKPLPLLRWLIENATYPGNTVLDPFMGSGTTLRAAKDLGRHAVGVEIEEHYCEIAASRLAQEVLPL